MDKKSKKSFIVKADKGTYEISSTGSVDFESDDGKLRFHGHLSDVINGIKYGIEKGSITVAKSPISAKQ